LQQNTMPVEILRAILTNEKLSPEFKSSWRFINELQAVPARQY